MEAPNENVKKMLETVHAAHECIAFLQTALLQNSPSPLKACREKTAFIKKADTELTGKITRLAKEDPAYRVYLSGPQLLSRIGENIEKLDETVSRKIKDDILFSDRAVSELTILFRRLGEILKSTADLLETRNQVLIRHIGECEEDVVKKALEYATHHEERLIEGLCQPVASSYFLNMLNSIRCIAWDAKEIAAKFAEKHA
jgi:Na+/phosphate symporter